MVGDIILVQQKHWWKTKNNMSMQVHPEQHLHQVEDKRDFVLLGLILNQVHSSWWRRQWTSPLKLTFEFLIWNNNLRFWWLWKVMGGSCHDLWWMDGGKMCLKWCFLYNINSLLFVYKLGDDPLIIILIYFFLLWNQ